MYRSTITEYKNDETVPLWCSQRWILAYIAFLGFGVVYSLRVNFSVAIVCMLKPANNSELVVSGNVSESLGSECGVLEKTASSSEVSCGTADIIFMSFMLSLLFPLLLLLLLLLLSTTVAVVLFSPPRDQHCPF